FEETIRIPDKMLGKDYVIAVSKGQQASMQQTGFVYINWGANAGGMSAPTITANYTCLTSRNNIWVIPNEDLIFINSSIGKLNISNIGGSIHFSKA
ncbi:MAG: hypothetical protein NT051_00485, partial [Candidatus Micrarchaeota archaeon]|nr:hypothetical protein [Candidatus Micrarchaeota archaeon]